VPTGSCRTADTTDAADAGLRSVGHNPRGRREFVPRQSDLFPTSRESAFYYQTMATPQMWQLPCHLHSVHLMSPLCEVRCVSRSELHQMLLHRRLLPGLSMAPQRS
jgi:hypothetical protein